MRRDLAEFERAMIGERVLAGVASIIARKNGRR